MENKNDTLTGVVLCGGKSRRMGTDKGLVKHGVLTWAEIALEKLKRFTNKIYISINPTQKKEYQKVFSDELLIEDNITLKGPLAGLFSAHKNLPDKDIFLLACDMLKIDHDTLENLAGVYYSNKKLYDFFVYKRNVNYETLAGIYTNAGIAKAYKSYLNSSLNKNAINNILEEGSTYAMKIRKREKFFDYNYPSDISPGSFLSEAV